MDLRRLLALVDGRAAGVLGTGAAAGVAATTAAAAGEAAGLACSSTAAASAAIETASGTAAGVAATEGRLQLRGGCCLQPLAVMVAGAAAAGVSRTAVRDRSTRRVGAAAAGVDSIAAGGEPAAGSAFPTML